MIKQTLALTLTKTLILAIIAGGE